MELKTKQIACLCTSIEFSSVWFNQAYFASQSNLHSVDSLLYELRAHFEILHLVLGVDSVVDSFFSILLFLIIGQWFHELYLIRLLKTARRMVHGLSTSQLHLYSVVSRVRVVPHIFACHRIHFMFFAKSVKIQLEL